MKGTLKAAIFAALVTVVFSAIERVIKGGFQIQHTGVYPPRQSETGLLMYATFYNEFSYDINIIPRVDDCCEIFYTNEATCSHINVLLSPMHNIAPYSSGNITFLYPTMYPHDRRGACRISVAYKATTDIHYKILNHRFYFDTYLPEEAAVKGSWRTFKTQCKTPDLDPFDNCKPVDCQMKYLSARPYFSPPFQLCVPSPNCNMQICDRGCPDVVYEPLSNTCEDMTPGISDDDLKSFHSADISFASLHRHGFEGSWDLHLAMKTFKCHHGHLNHRTFRCDCSIGWTSTPFDWEQYVPSNSHYHMCNTPQAAIERVYPTFSHIDFGKWIRSAIISAAILLGCLFASLCRLEPRRILFPRKKPFIAVATVESFGDTRAQVVSTHEKSELAAVMSTGSFIQDSAFSEYNLASEIFDPSSVSRLGVSESAISSESVDEGDSTEKGEKKRRKR